ncbi:hypothetical protein [Paraburkholderia sp. SIMBA_030]|uniref:hypothetical protein n=1 Tax=Paraburkholderia sp. SIMBA_030 TaxID=3085773 RepID=UPI003979CF75
MQVAFGELVDTRHDDVDVAGGQSGHPALDKFVVTFPSRFKALYAARDELVAELGKPDLKRDKKTVAALLWLGDLVKSERQKLVDYARTQQRMASLAPLAKQVKTKATPLHPATAWPFPSSPAVQQALDSIEREAE